jgi:hypothetical protein
MANLTGVMLVPPMAFARFGDSKIPLDAFDWATDTSAHGGGRTIIRPAVSLDVQPDGTLRPRLPAVIQFRDGLEGSIRPTAPFFEVWGFFDDAAEPRPLTGTTLAALGSGLGSVTWQVSVANLKAARRTRDQACGFMAEVSFPATDAKPKALLAISPNVAGSAPLVTADSPIPLGSVQAMQPFAHTALGIDLDVLRLRFTPATGEVYGPPSATLAADPDAPASSLAQYEIVPARNRTLNPAATWSSFRPQTQTDQPEPSDTFDGVLDLADGSIGGQSWGVVDDTCDGVIRVSVEVGPERFVATARVSCCPPDFAPDRRPFASIADDLSDRDLPALNATEIATPETVLEVADLLLRVFETVSLTNLDALRSQMLRGAPPDSGPVPHTDVRSMTQADAPLADQAPAITEDRTGGGLGLTLVAGDVHSALIDIDNMITLFRQQPERIKHIIRPPFAHFSDLPDSPAQALPTDALGPDGTQVLRAVERDPRRLRDQQHDMRMPPYMRDADALPLSLSWRQYHEVIDLIDHLSKLDDAGFEALSPVRQHVAAVIRRRTSAASESLREPGDGRPS